MNWSLWVPIFALISMPISLLMADRILGLPAHRVTRWLGPPWLAALAALLAWGAGHGEPVVRLVGWGALAGFLATIALDAVRLIGLRLGLFPMDMPMMFGMIFLGKAPLVQRNVIGRMVEMVSALPDDQRRAMMQARLRAISGLQPRKRRAVVGAMMAGLQRLPEDRRRAMMTTQMTLLSELPPDLRLTMMQTMDEVSAGVSPDGLAYGQPRGLPKIPMTTFRRLAEKGLPDAIEEAGLRRWQVALAGYVAHFVFGTSFGVMYTMLAGDGSWGWAFAWGGFVWLAMMVVMPPMMPAIRFPARFPIWPALAHAAMAVPIAAVALAWVSGADAELASILRHFT